MPLPPGKPEPKIAGPAVDFRYCEDVIDDVESGNAGPEGLWVIRREMRLARAYVRLLEFEQRKREELLDQSMPGWRYHPRLWEV